MSTEELSAVLIEILKENNGSLGNGKAKDLLARKTNTKVDDSKYELAKESLLSQGKIIRGRGQGGSIKLANGENESNREASSEDMLEHLMTSVNYTPGITAKRNRASLTLSFGEDGDKLFAAWERNKKLFSIQYRVERDKVDHSKTALDVFRKASSKPELIEERTGYSVTLWTEDGSIEKANNLCRRIHELLEDTTLDNNLPGTGIEAESKPNPESYYTEIAKIIKYCVDENLSWPLVNWRKTLGFDDVDGLIVVGHTQKGLIDKYREHVVPASLIKNYSMELAKEGAPVKVIADFIKCHLFLVYVSEREARILNASKDRDGKGLKTSMPHGWVWGEDPMERITTGLGVPVAYIKQNSVKRWNPWKRRVRDTVRSVLERKIIKLE